MCCFWKFILTFHLIMCFELLECSHAIAELQIRALRSKLVIKFLSRDFSRNIYFAKFFKQFWHDNFDIYKIFRIFRVANFAKIWKSEYSAFRRALLQILISLKGNFSTKPGCDTFL